MKVFRRHTYSVHRYSGTVHRAAGSEGLRWVSVKYGP
jgi:hypothetical protein